MKMTLVLCLLTPSFLIATEPLRFESFPQTNTIRETPAPLDLKSHPKGYEYRTRLSEGASGKRDFAGFYTVVMWGCGSPCQQVALIDARDGKVYFAPFVTALGGRFRLNSRLFMKDAPDDIAEFNAYDWVQGGPIPSSEYWLWDEKSKRFNLLFTTEPKPKSKPEESARTK
jgi:hypothetical protein